MKLFFDILEADNILLARQGSLENGFEFALGRRALDFGEELQNSLM